MWRTGLAFLILATGLAPLMAEEDPAGIAWVSYVEGAVERRVPDGPPEPLDTADDLLASDQILLGEASKLTLVLASEASFGKIVVLRGRVEGTVANLLAAAAKEKEAEAPAVPAELAAAIQDPWDIDLGTAPRTRAAGSGELRGLYPSGKIVGPCGDFVFNADIELPEDCYYEIRLYVKKPSRRRKVEPVATLRCRESPASLDPELASIGEFKRLYWQVAALLEDGSEGLVGDIVQFEPVANPVKDALPAGGFTTPDARASWHLACAKALVRKRLYADAYREYTRLTTAGGSSRKVKKELKRLQKRLGFDDEEVKRLVAGFEVQQASSDVLHLKDGRVMEGRVVHAAGDAVLFEVLGTRYRIPRSQVRSIEDSGRDPLPSAAPFVTVTSKRYLVETNAGEAYGKEVLRHLEALYDRFRETLGKGLGARQAKNLRAKIFRDPTDFRAYLSGAHTAQRDGQGFYSFGEGTLYLYRSFDKEKETTWFTLFHEGTHQLLHSLCNQNGAANALPHFWLLEAIPCYMESLTWDDDELVIGAPNPARVQNYLRVVRSGRSMPWPRFFTITQAGYSNADAYDQGHALFWYLMHADDGEHQKPLFAFTTWILSVKNREAAEEKTFRRPLAEIARRANIWFEKSLATSKFDVRKHGKSSRSR